MGRSRELEGFAYNIAQKFAVSENHFAWLAWQHGVTTIEINLLTGTISPALFDIERNQILTNDCRRNLEWIRKKFDYAAFRETRLRITYFLDKQEETSIEAIYECAIKDNHGRLYRGVVHESTLMQA